MFFEGLLHLSQTTQLALVLICVIVVASLMRVFKQPLLVGYLLAWVVIWAVWFHHQPEGSFFQLFSQLGIALLLFLVWLWLNPATIKEHGKISLGAGLAQIALCSLLWVGLSVWLWFDRQSARLIALAISFSSTIVIVKLLHDTQDADSVYGRISIGILIVQDIVAMILLMVIALRWPQSSGGNLMLVEGIGLVAWVIAVSKWIMPHVLPRMAQTHELMLLIGIWRCLLLWSLFQGVWFSYEIWCLLAGMSFAVSPRRRVMMEKLQPLRDFFIVIFFVHLWMLVDINVIGTYLREIIVLLLLVVVGKPLITYLIVVFAWYAKKVAFKVATTLGQMSEFGLILMTLGVQSGMIENTDLVSVIMIVALLSILISWYVITNNHRLTYRWTKIVGEEKQIDMAPKTTELVDVVVIGYGKFGQRIAHLLREQWLLVWVMETNPNAYLSSVQHGFITYFADATNEESFRECFGAQSKMVISTVREFDDDWIIAHHIKKMNQSTIMVALTLHQEYSVELYDAWCDYVLLPYHISAHHMADLIEELQFDLKRFLEKKTYHRELIALLMAK